MKKRFNNSLAFDYMLNAIDPSGFDIEVNTDVEKLQFVLNCFNNEFNYEYNKKNVPNLQTRFAEYLMCLPSCINIDLENYKILEIAEKWESIPNDATESQKDKILNNWFNFISSKFFRLCDKNKVDYSFLR